MTTHLPKTVDGSMDHASCVLLHAMDQQRQRIVMAQSQANDLREELRQCERTVEDAHFRIDQIAAALETLGVSVDA